MDRKSSREAASFRSEMGFDSPGGGSSPYVPRRQEDAPEEALSRSSSSPAPVASSAFDRRGEARPTLSVNGRANITGALPRASESPSSHPLSASMGDKSPRDRTSVPRVFRFGRASEAGDSDAAIVSSTLAVSTPAVRASERKSPRNSLTTMFHRAAEDVSPRGSPRASQESESDSASPPPPLPLGSGSSNTFADRPKSPRTSISQLFRRSVVVEEVDGSSPPGAAAGAVPGVALPSVSPRGLPNNKKTAVGSDTGAASGSKNARSLAGGRGGGSHVAAQAPAVVGPGRGRVSDRRRSRSLHNILRHEEEPRDELSGPGLFGMSLDALMKRQPPDALNGSDAVPHVMDLLLRRMEGAGGFKAEGIFRLSVGSLVKEAAMARLHRFDYTLPSGDYDDPHLYCVLLKEWLKRLPLPLLADYAGCLELAACPPEREDAIAGRLWRGMTPLAQAVLHRLMRFVRTAVAYEKVTRMSETNLCIVFAPGILRPFAEQSALDMLRDQAATQAALLKMYQWVIKLDGPEKCDPQV
jgi:hypothetical protein